MRDHAGLRGVLETAAMQERRIPPPRTRTLKKGRIAFNQQRSTIDCTVRNLSPHGALLIVATPVGIPDSFELFIESDHVRKPARIIWRKDDRIGIAFA
jgi:hypothetical protein